jgi:adenosylcobinamide kinase/adenosylcobinamide-phosphate guanylyltransferase
MTFYNFLTLKKRIVFITGGARSGKSEFALKTAEKMGKKKAYIATAESLDDEMRDRIEMHRKQRGNEWHTIEEPRNLAKVFKSLQSGYDIAIVDCLTLWISNLMGDGLTDEAILKKADTISNTVDKVKCSIIFVSNEVGMGIVPENPLARRFRDVAGKVNQTIASISDEVYYMVAGIPVKIK